MNDQHFSRDDEEDDQFDIDDGGFSITDGVFFISGHKIDSILVDGESLRFSSGRFQFAEDFEAAWLKKWSMATKLRVRHSSIRWITNEDQELKVRIGYKTRIGIPSECEFSFFDARVCAAFLTYMEKEQYFTYTHGRMLPFKAVSRHILGLVFTIAMTWGCWYIVADQKHGGTDEGSDVKARLFVYLLGLLGEKGVLAIGIGICGYIGFQIWKRAGNPPYRVKLVK